MLTVILVAKIIPGYENEFEDRITKLFSLVSAEPGCRGVTWGRTEIAGEYALIERYVDHVALSSHRTSPHMKQYGADLTRLFDGAPTLARFIEQGELVAS